MRSRTRTLAGTVGALAFLALGPMAPAQAATNGFSCRAETLNASLFKQKPLQPLEHARARWRLRHHEGAPERRHEAPAYQTVRATSGVADARINASGNVLRVQAVQAESQASCVNRQVVYNSSGRVAGLTLFGQSIPLNDGLTTLITGLDGVTKVLVSIRLNEVTRDASGYTFRALHVRIPQDGSILDVSVGLNRLNTVGSPCTDFTGGPGGGGGNGGGTPTPGGPFGGGNVLKVKDVTFYGLYKRISLCVRSPRYGRQVAIVGNNKRNKITGSKLSDRIFAYGARDLLNGGSGNDCIEAGSGSDIVNGGTGHDALYGRGGRDYLDGGAGRDRIWGGPGVDTIVTGSGRDRVSGGSGNDKIFTRDGRDRVSGGSGNDRIFAAARGRRDRIRCGSGFDRVRADAYDIVSKDCEVVIIARGTRR